MSVTLALVGALVQPITTTLSNTTETDVFAPTAPQQFTVFEILLCNTSSGALVTQLFWNDGTTSFQFFEKSVATDATDTVSVALPVNPAAPNGSGAPKKIRAKLVSGSGMNVTVLSTATMGQR